MSNCRFMMTTLCGVLAILAAPTVSWASLLSEKFDDYAVGTAPVPPWSLTGTAEAAISVAFAVSGSASLHIRDDGDLEEVKLRRSFAPTTHLVLEYYMLSTDATREGAMVTLEGDVGSEYFAGFSNGVFGSQAGYIGINGGGMGWVKPDLLSYSENTWYYVRRELDLVTNTGFFYVEEVGNPTHNALYSIGRNTYFNNSTLDTLLLFSSYSQGADGYLDSITVVPEPATLSLLSLGLAGLVLRRKRK